MVPIQVWVEMISWSKTLFDASKSAIDLVSTFNKYQRDAKTIAEAQEARRVSTFSDEEVGSLAERIQNCRNVFTMEGTGEARVRCLCSVLNQAKDGNGGELPDISNWREIYTALKCATRGANKAMAAH